MSARPTDTWSAYVENFHDERPGITERVLSRCAGPGGRDPYSWLVDSLPAAGLVLDVACGSGPIRDRAPRWVGIDRSPRELDAAETLGRGPLVAARADALPIAPAATTSVVAAMSLMVLDDPPAALAEVARVLRPDGRLAVLVPTGRPLTARDRARYALLLAVIGRFTMPFPQLEVVRDPRRSLRSAGFEVLRDERARFALTIGGRDDAALFVESLYLPDVTVRRVDAARRVVHGWRRHDIGVPLRRLVARPAHDEAT